MLGVYGCIKGVYGCIAAGLPWHGTRDKTETAFEKNAQTLWVVLGVDGCNVEGLSLKC